MTTSNIFPNLSAWQASHAYTVGQRVSNDSPVKAYECVTAGTSAGSGGPTGTGSSIADGGVTWKFLATVDFTSVASWIIGMGTISAPQVGQLWKGDNAGANTAVAMAAVNINNGGTSSSNTITLQCAPGESVGSNTANPLAYDPTKGVAFSNANNYGSNTTLTIGVDHVTVGGPGVGIQFSNTGSAPALNNGANSTIDSCLVKAVSSASGNAPITLGSSPSSIVKNTVVIFNSGNTFPAITGTRGTVTNCTVMRTSNNAAAGVGIGLAYSPSTGQNNAVFGFTTPLSGGGTYDHTGTDQASASGSSNTVNVAFTTATFAAIGATPNVKLVSGSALLGAGSQAEAPAADFYNTARGSISDLGAMQFSAAPPPSAARPFMGFP